MKRLLNGATKILENFLNLNLNGKFVSKETEETTNEDVYEMIRFCILITSPNTLDFNFEFSFIVSFL